MEKTLAHEKKKKVREIQILLILISPSVVVISGAKMKCTIVSNDKKKNNTKIKQSTEISNSVKS